MPLSLTRRVRDRIRFRLDDHEVWLTVTGFLSRDVLLEFVYAPEEETFEVRANSKRPIHLHVGDKVVEIRIGERTGNQVRLSFGGDTGVEVLREELLAGRKASA